MWNPVGAQIGRHIRVENSEGADDGAAGIGKQREADAALLRKLHKRFEGVVADRRQADALLLQQMPRVFQLDQLGAAVLSPVRATVKNQEEAVRASEIGEHAQVAMLIGEGEIGDSFTWLRAGLVVIVGGVKVFGVQLGRDGFTSRAQPAEFAHDGGFFSQVFGGLVARVHIAHSTADARPRNRRYTKSMKTSVSMPDEVFERAEHLTRPIRKSRSHLYRAASEG